MDPCSLTWTGWPIQEIEGVSVSTFDGCPSSTRGNWNVTCHFNTMHRNLLSLVILYTGFPRSVKLDADDASGGIASVQTCGNNAAGCSKVRSANDATSASPSHCSV